jgi:hypothetical protein
LKYEDSASAKKALEALAGRKFADRTVVVTWFDEVSTPFCEGEMWGMCKGDMLMMD